VETQNTTTANLTPFHAQPKASTANTKQVTRGLAPHLTPALLTALVAIPIESMTLEQFAELGEALAIATNTGLRPPPNTEIGAILT
jgi:hypothetical protein